MEQPDQPSNFSLEQAFKRIKEIQTLLQGGALPFEESLLLFEEGEKLIQQSQQYLSQAELRIQYLTGEKPTENE
jgi:exodeoxyribonuclease VII small subunit